MKTLNIYFFCGPVLIVLQRNLLLRILFNHQPHTKKRPGTSHHSSIFCIIMLKLSVLSAKDYVQILLVNTSTNKLFSRYFWKSHVLLGGILSQNYRKDSKCTATL